MMSLQKKQFRSTLLYILLLTQWLFALLFVTMLGGWENGLKYIYFSPEWNLPQIYAVVTITIWLTHFPVMFLLRRYFYGNMRVQQMTIIGAYYITAVISATLVGSNSHIPLTYVIFGCFMAILWYFSYPFQKRLTKFLTICTCILVGSITYMVLPDRYCWDQLAKNQVDQSISTAGNYQMVYVENCMKEFKKGPIMQFIY